MLSDQEIARAALELAEFRRNDALAKLLDQYEVLIQSYKRLKSDYEEEREAREKYKQMAKDQERNPFVLVLVDGDGYVFNENLIAKKAEGGNIAAQMLNDEIKASLRRRGLEHCQIMIRVYANVKGLSHALCKAGLVGGESRSLAPFIASFNRSYGLTEFVDAGELKENADFKLRALLRLYADNTQCKHIYFAACHDVGYISELTPFMGNSSKFTLINTPGIRFHDEFTKLGMGIEEFRNVFTHRPLDGLPYRPATNGTGNHKIPAVPTSPIKPSATLSTPSTKSSSKDESKTICIFHTIGKCRYGKSCKNLHPIEASSDVKSVPSTPTFSTTSSSKIAPTTDEFPGPFANLVADLPRKSDIPPGFVAVNANNYRLDPILPRITPEQQSRLKARIDKRRVCNNYQLSGRCDNGDRCEYDHTPLEEDLKPALECLARSQPCSRRGACRIDGCPHGHICQILDCKFRGGKTYCRLGHLAHGEKLVFDRLVPAIGRKGTGSVMSGSSASSG
ncbi:uncharacterized protein CTHT_0018920 [Thermochaetoides thermophila DSM 1495]|uniref:C3H1-type domain-containing protein n=1 Tax=Chaetomium thermophilum (strain DSM 1495 / CBS 144.50 / IMI 039719) TaxID=759272 RepID=G0S2Y3_CHATD|nr:hypothetical protein CTHT_0018920 [Thermochaetoides thermophila DSM 1495]EGS22366.1 hypothetical protein CTHT_0018920 [Thermochaetoides thermophila DSM 1495]